jgi:hypothetical protein
MTCPPCTHNCRQGRDCTARADLPGVHQDDGGHAVNAGIAFPIEREYADDRVTTSEAAGAWTCISQILLIAIVVFCLAAAFIQIVLPPFYR